jgi:uncharacterized protein (TIGR00251 family)
MIKQTKDGLMVSLKISPNAKKNEIIKDESGIKIKITAQPVEGKANKALIEFLSKTFKVPKTSVEIVKGDTSKEKTVLFRTSDEDKISIISAAFSQ